MIRDLTLKKLMDILVFGHPSIFIIYIYVQLCTPPSAILLLSQLEQYTHSKIVLSYLLNFIIYYIFLFPDAFYFQKEQNITLSYTHTCTEGYKCEDVLGIMIYFIMHHAVHRTICGKCEVKASYKL